MMSGFEQMSFFVALPQHSAVSLWLTGKRAEFHFRGYASEVVEA